MKRITRKNIRLTWWDYSASWYYYITICTKNRKNMFWEIINWNMILNNEWNIVKNEIIKTWIIRNNVFIDEYIIMPNHLHVIIIINKEDIGYLEHHVVTERQQPFPTWIFNVSMDDKGKKEYNTFNKLWPQKNNLSSNVIMLSICM